LRESVLDSPGSGEGSVTGYRKDKNKPYFVYHQKSLHFFGVVHLPSVFQKQVIGYYISVLGTWETAVDII